MKKSLILLLKLYRYVISPMFGPSCRFHPTCSSYAIHAIEMHGPLKGAWLTLKRLLRCHPWHCGGHDPVPPRECR